MVKKSTVAKVGVGVAAIGGVAYLAEYFLNPCNTPGTPCTTCVDTWKSQLQANENEYTEKYLDFTKTDAAEDVPVNSNGVTSSQQTVLNQIESEITTDLAKISACLAKYGSPVSVILKKLGDIVEETLKNAWVEAGIASYIAYRVIKSIIKHSKKGKPPTTGSGIASATRAAVTEQEMTENVLPASYREGISTTLSTYETTQINLSNSEASEMTTIITASLIAAAIAAEIAEEIATAVTTEVAIYSVEAIGSSVIVLGGALAA